MTWQGGQAGADLAGAGTERAQGAALGVLTGRCWPQHGERTGSCPTAANPCRSPRGGGTLPHAWPIVSFCCSTNTCSVHLKGCKKNSRQRSTPRQLGLGTHTISAPLLGGPDRHGPWSDSCCGPKSIHASTSRQQLALNPVNRHTPPEHTHTPLNRDTHPLNTPRNSSSTPDSTVWHPDGLPRQPLALPAHQSVPPLRCGLLAASLIAFWSGQRLCTFLFTTSSSSYHVLFH